MVSGQASQYQTGMRWPHQIWRLIVQSRMFSIQWKYVRSKRLGTNSMRPSRTASMAGRASGSARTNHCSEMIGSTIVPERWQWPTECSYRSVRSSSPAASRSATTRSRASKRSIPAYWPASSVSRPSAPMMLSTGSPWRCPMSKSTGS